MGSKQALAGIKVLELAGLVPVPFCGLLLADFGADVIRVDRASSDDTIDMLCRGKRSIQLDLKKPEGKKCLLELVKKADVLIDPFRPGVLESLQLGPEILLDLNPGLVVARISGFGQDGKFRLVAGHDLNYLAISGVLGRMGPAGEAPGFPINLVGDFAGGSLMCAYGIVMALFHRSTSGKGQVVDCGMTDGANYLSTFLFSGLFNNGRGNNIIDGGAYFYGVYKTKDDKYMSVGSIEMQFYNLLIEKLEFTEQEKENFPGFHLDPSQWPRMKEVFKKKFLTKTQAEWTAIFGDSDACCHPVLEGEDFYNHEHVVSRKMIITQADGTKLPAPAPRLSGTPAIAEGKITPRVGEHTMEVLTEYGIPMNRIQELLKIGAIKHNVYSNL